MMPVCINSASMGKAKVYSKWSRSLVQILKALDFSYISEILSTQELRDGKMILSFLPFMKYAQLQHTCLVSPFPPLSWALYESDHMSPFIQPKTNINKLTHSKTLSLHHYYILTLSQLK